MLKKMMKRLKKEEKGFTLIELLAVIVILAVIAVIAVPLIGKIIDNTKKDADVATAQQIYDAAKLYVTGELAGDFNGSANTGLTVYLSDLISKKYLANNTALPSSKNNLVSGSSTASATEVVFDTNGDLTSVKLSDGTTTKTIDANELKLGKGE
ncbi:type II secretion system protein [Paenibacillus sp. MMO-58]|uniref:type II secretion system protein n=1 Tax=Paenibacillus sp. MMO-58 TaxID=3081290 RepID=UPI003018FA7F